MPIFCNHKDLGAYINTTMGKGFLACLLTDERKQKAERASKLEYRKQVVDRIATRREQLQRGISKGMVVVSDEVANAARKRRRITKGAPEGEPTTS